MRTVKCRIVLCNLPSRILGYESVNCNRYNGAKTGSIEHYDHCSGYNVFVCSELHNFVENGEINNADRCGGNKQSKYVFGIQFSALKLACNIYSTKNLWSGLESFLYEPKTLLQILP